MSRQAKNRGASNSRIARWALLPAVLTLTACGEKSPRQWTPIDSEICESYEPEPEAPTVLLLVDQSGSMTEPFGNQTRWEALYEALMDPSGVVKRLEDEVRFGLTLYTYATAACPALQGVAPRVSNYQEIDQLYGPSSPQYETPTGPSLQAAAEELADLDVKGSKLILLATDGEPSPCPGDSPDAQATAVDAAQDAFDLGIKTVILTVGTDVSEAHQQDMANAGAGLPLDSACPDCAPLYRPDNKQKMIEAIESIVAAERTCLFDLERPLDPSAAEGTVALDGELLGYGDPDGWRLASPMQIELVGAACEKFLDSGGKLESDYPCEAYGLPE